MKGESLERLWAAIQRRGFFPSLWEGLGEGAKLSANFLEPRSCLPTQHNQEKDLLSIPHPNPLPRERAKRFLVCDPHPGKKRNHRLKSVPLKRRVNPVS